MAVWTCYDDPVYILFAIALDMTENFSQHSFRKGDSDREASMLANSVYFDAPQSAMKHLSLNRPGTYPLSCFFPAADADMLQWQAGAATMPVLQLTCSRSKRRTQKAQDQIYAARLERSSPLRYLSSYAFASLAPAHQSCHQVRSHLTHG